MKVFDKIASSIQKCINKMFGSGLAQDSTKGEGDAKFSAEEERLALVAAQEGIVLLENDGVLPLRGKVAVFGRCQVNSFYVGYGSGGDVKAPYKVSILQGLEEAQGEYFPDETLANKYRKWCKRHTPNEGYWGHWPMNYPEMPLDRQTVEDAAKRNSAALVIIGRAAGEDRENKLEKGSYYLTDAELDMLDKVTSAFEKVAVVLNCGNVIDLSWTEKYKGKISALVYAWQGGMVTGRALANLLCGKASPCAKLPMTIARNYSDYPSSENFGNREFNFYKEDIFVGYRYFSTFAKEKVLYPFGYGLSYTQFDIAVKEFNSDGKDVVCRFTVKNTGKTAGKEVVQLYVRAPQGKLGKAALSLVGFYKTDELKAGEEERGEIRVKSSDFASYDDSGATGNKHCYVLEEGTYTFLIGASSDSLKKAGECERSSLEVVGILQGVCGVKEKFERIIAAEEDGKIVMKHAQAPLIDYSLKERILKNLPKAIAISDREIDFKEVMQGNVTVQDFVATLDKKELEALTRGYGCMGAKQGPAGNAGVYGGVIPSLEKKGVPAVTTTDGPAGIRLNARTALLPCGTALASSWNPVLVTQLYACVGEEMKAQGTQVLLAPGMNIQRDPLCGRNFEYFSEDPLLSGKIAAAMVNGVQSKGVSACPKHFACNNQEVNRNYNDSRVSERALREIYLKGFEICIKESAPHCIMTSYNKINGVWSHYNYDLATTVLRGEWKYKGLVITDWWMRKSASPEFPAICDNAYRVRAQVDVFMPGNMTFAAKKYTSDGTLLKTLGEEGGITLGEIQRTAANTLKNVLILKGDK